MSIRERKTLLCCLAFVGSAATYPMVSQAATSHIERVGYSKPSQGSITFHVGQQQLSNKPPGITVHLGDEVQIIPDKASDKSIFAIHLSSKMNAEFNSTGSAKMEFIPKTTGTITFEIYNAPPGAFTGQQPIHKLVPGAQHGSSEPIGKFVVTVVK